MPAAWQTGNGSEPGPLPFGELFAPPPAGPLDPLAPGFPLDGFDVRFAQLVFTTMLGAELRFMPYNTYLEMLLALREGVCDVAIGSLSPDSAYASCSAALCPPVPASGYFDLGDYDYATSFTPVLQASACCLTFSTPYQFDGFGLLSRRTGASLLDSINSSDVINVGVFVALLNLLAGWLAYGVETCAAWRKHRLEGGPPPRGTVGRWVYWSLTLYSTTGFGDVAPESGLGKLVSSLWMIVSVLCSCVFASILTSRVTAATLTGAATIDTLDDVTGLLCVTCKYARLEQFVAVSPGRPSRTLVYASEEDCVALVLNATAQAHISDRSTLTWFVRTYGLGGALRVSAALNVNPNVMMYANGSELRTYAEPAVVTAITDRSWLPSLHALQMLYFPPDDSSGAVVDAALIGGGKVSRALVAATIALAAFTGVAAAVGSRKRRHRFSKALRYVTSPSSSHAAAEQLAAGDVTSSNGMQLARDKKDEDGGDGPDIEAHTRAMDAAVAAARQAADALDAARARLIRPPPVAQV